MIKFDLTNGFFHINLHKKAQDLLGVKCQNKYYKIKKLPQGLSISPYLMQRVMQNILTTLLGGLPIKFLVYLDDILLMGSRAVLEQAKIILLASSFLFNMDKCSLIPSRTITYLGINIYLDLGAMALTKEFVNKIVKELIHLKNHWLTLRYKQRLAGLLNFAAPILFIYPRKLSNLAFIHHRKPFKFINFIHPYFMSYKTFVNTLPVYSDATPTQIGILAPYEQKFEIFKSKNNILENEYLGVSISHILRPYSRLITDNMAVLHLFRKGRLPPSWWSNYRISKILIETFHRPLVFYIPRNGILRISFPGLLYPMLIISKAGTNKGQNDPKHGYPL